MYEQFRNEALANLGTNFSAEQLRIIGDALDRAAQHYKIERNEMALATSGDIAMQMIETYCVCKKIEGRSDGTIYNYGKCMKLFFDAVQKAPDKVTANDIRIYLYKYKEERHISDRSLDKLREYIKHFYVWAVSEGYVSSDPTAIIKPIRYEHKPRTAMSQVQLEYIRKACKTPREKCIVEVLYSTGCRVSELAGIKRSDIDFDDGTVTLFGKGKKYRTGYLNAKAMVMIKEYLATRKGESEYLIKSEKGNGPLTKAGIEKIIKTLVQRAGLPENITPHIFRHTTATQALHSGMPVQDIQHMLGHANISTTMIYAETDEASVASNHEKYVV